MMHEFGHAVYDLGLDTDLPWLLRSPAHILSTEAIAILFGSLPFQYKFVTGMATSQYFALT